MNETHTYPDGSARVGCPPFPKLSPIEQAAGKQEPEVQTETPDKPKRAPRQPKAE